MSDWITHIGWVYPAGRIATGAHLRLALLGAILPDVFTPLIVLANNLHAYPGWVEAYLQPLQAPLPTGLIAGAVALLTRRPGASFAALALGATIHYALDLTQIRYGGGIYVRYPVDFASPSLDWYWPESWVNVGLLAGGAAGLAWALVRPGPRIEWSGARRIPAVALAAVALVLPAFTIDAFHRANVNNVAFFRSPTAFQGVPLALGQVEVVSVQPGTVNGQPGTGQPGVSRDAGATQSRATRVRGPRQPGTPASEPGATRVRRSRQPGTEEPGATRVMGKSAQFVTAEGFRVDIRKGAHRVRAVIPAFARWPSGVEAAVPGERISLRGRYDRGAFRATGPAHVHIRPLRTWTSLVGLVAILIIVLPSRRQRGS